jgi:peptide/nickel transport system permease protein
MTGRQRVRAAVDLLPRRPAALKTAATRKHTTDGGASPEVGSRKPGKRLREKELRERARPRRRVPFPALLSFIYLAILIIAAVFAPLIAPDSPDHQDYNAFLQAPNAHHWLGTDEIGRDVLTRLIYGARISLEVGTVAVCIAVMGGLIVGTWSGYVGGWADNLVMRVCEAFQAFPSLILAMTLTAVFGPSTTNLMIVLGGLSIPEFSRIARGQTLVVRSSDYVAAARYLGYGTPRILRRHTIPNAISPVVVQASFLFANVIVAEAGLSFLGLGVTPPTPSWGSMLQEGYDNLSVAPWLSVFPGLAIFVTVLAINFVGDFLRANLTA